MTNANLYLYLSVTYKQIESFEAIPGVTSVLLTWTVEEDVEITTGYYCLEYFPVLFPNMVVITNTTNTTYEAIGLIPQAVYHFEMRPKFEGDAAVQGISMDVILDKPIRKLNHQCCIELFH